MPEDSGARLDAHQLAALAAVIQSGSFDAAAEWLHVTPSAISQRIKTLEQRIGQVLVVREKPCRPTAAGIPILRLAAQTALLEAEALAESTGESASLTRIAVAVNADSISTWFTAVLAELPDILFDVRIEDQDHSARLLREGAVMGAVTTERIAVPGCRVQPLGVMRYLPVASPSYVDQYLSEGFTRDAVAAAPSIAWNRDDALQDMLVRKAFRCVLPRPVHYVPTTEGFGAAVRAGLGWGMYPEQLVERDLAERTLVVPPVSSESAGINRHEEGDVRALHRRSSDPRWPRAMRWRSVRAQRSVGQGYVQAGLLSREIRESGVPTSSNWAEGNIVGGVIASRRRTPRGQRTCACTESSCARTGRSHVLPAVVDRGAGRSGNAEAARPRCTSVGSRTCP
jgi:LysR family transcriptional regulator, chromosome initiation inhibitor